jgi:MFS family permease
MPRVRQSFVVALLTLFMAINFADKAVFGLCAGPLIREFELSNTQFGVIGSLFFVLFSISAFVVGRIADRGKSNALLAGMAIVWSSALFLGAAATNAIVLSASRIVLGAGEGPAFPVALHAGLDGVSAERFPRVSSTLIAGAPIGVMLASLLITPIIVKFGWRAAFATLGFMGLLWLLAWAATSRFRIPDGPPSTERSQAGDISTTAILFKPAIIGITLATFAAYLANSITIVWFPRVLEAGAGFSPSFTGVLLAVGWFLQIPVALLGGFAIEALRRRMPHPSTIYALCGGGALAVVGLALVGLSAFGNSALISGLVVISLVSTIVVFAVSGPVAADIVPESLRGTAFGAIVAVYAPAGIIGPACLVRWSIMRAARAAASRLR